MAQDFNKMSKEELEALLNADSLAQMNRQELNSFRNAVKAAGLLSVQNDSILGIAINNRTYEEIKNSQDYTEEEKALALETREEYNNELRAQIKDEHYNAQEIMSRAVFDNGKYHFTELTKGEMDFLVNNGVIRKSELSLDKTYNIGQESNRNFSKEVVTDTKDLPEDVQKSAEFWNKFNDNKTGISYIIEALKNKSVKVEAKKDNKSVFTGIDHGNQGFDIVKKGRSVEPYGIFDLIIKKAKATNPKAKVRIKDNVKDEVTRNKILIACAKNNMEPVGNLPEGFDFAALKDMVKDIKDISVINALAKNLYAAGSFDFVKETPEQENAAVAAVVSPSAEKQNNNTVVAAIPVATSNQGNIGDNEKPNNNTVVAAIPVATGKQENIGNNEKQNIEEKAPVEAPKRPWWKKVRDAVVVGGIALLGIIGIRSCQNQERLEKKVKDLQEQVDRKSLEDCDALSAKFAEEYAKGYNDGKKDCEEQNKPKPKPVVKKQTPVKKVVAPKAVRNVVVLPNDTIKGDTVYIPGDTIKGEPVIITDTIRKQVVVEEKVPVQPVAASRTNIPLEAVDTSMMHEKDFDLNESVELTAKGEATKDNGKQAKGKTLDLSDPVVFNAVRNNINSNIK